MASAASPLRRRLSPFLSPHLRPKTTSAAHLAARHIDHTFEKHMSNYKHYLTVSSILDLILASPSLSLPLSSLSPVSQPLHLRRSAAHFLRAFPRVFRFLPDSTVAISPSAAKLLHEESVCISSDLSLAVDRVRRLLAMAPERTVPLRAVFRVWKELGLPDDFERSVLGRNSGVFEVKDNPKEKNTHLLRLAGANSDSKFVSAVEIWRRKRRCEEESGFRVLESRSDWNLTGSVENWIQKRDRGVLFGSKTGFSAFIGSDSEYGFKLEFPPGMKLKKNYRKKVKEWQELPYNGPYDEVPRMDGKSTKVSAMAMEKRAVAIAHEFLSLTVEKTLEVEKFSQFRKWFGIDFNVRDLFVDHPGIFYLSTRGRRHTVFLREAYDGGRLVEPNPVYEARRKLLDLVVLRRRGMGDKLVEDEGGDLRIDGSRTRRMTIDHDLDL